MTIVSIPGKNSCEVQKGSWRMPIEIELIRKLLLRRQAFKCEHHWRLRCSLRATHPWSDYGRCLDGHGEGQTTAMADLHCHMRLQILGTRLTV
jgi:hypothetical protein